VLCLLEDGKKSAKSDCSFPRPLGALVALVGEQSRLFVADRVAAPRVILV